MLKKKALQSSKSLVVSCLCHNHADVGLWHHTLQFWLERSAATMPTLIPFPMSHFFQGLWKVSRGTGSSCLAEQIGPFLVHMIVVALATEWTHWPANPLGSLQCYQRLPYHRPALCVSVLLLGDWSWMDMFSLPYVAPPLPPMTQKPDTILLLLPF